MRNLIIVALVGASSAILGCQRAPNTPLAQASEHVRYARWSQAIAVATPALAQDPDNHQLWMVRGNAFLGQGDHQKAVDDYTRVIELLPEDAEAYYRRAIAYEALGETELATADTRHARSIDTLREKAYSHVSPENAAGTPAVQLPASDVAGDGTNPSQPLDPFAVEGSEPGEASDDGVVAIVSEPDPNDIDTQVRDRLEATDPWEDESVTSEVPRKTDAELVQEMVLGARNVPEDESAADGEAGDAPLFGGLVPARPPMLPLGAERRGAPPDATGAETSPYPSPALSTNRSNYPLGNYGNFPGSGLGGAGLGGNAVAGQPVKTGIDSRGGLSGAAPATTPGPGVTYPQSSMWGPQVSGPGAAASGQPAGTMLPQLSGPSSALGRYYPGPVYPPAASASGPSASAATRRPGGASQLGTIQPGTIQPGTMGRVGVGPPAPPLTTPPISSALPENFVPMSTSPISTGLPPSARP